MQHSSRAVAVSRAQPLAKIRFVLFALMSLTVGVVIAVGAAGVARAQDNAPLFEQIKLTDAHIKGYVKVAPELMAVFEKLDQAEGKPSKAVEDQLKSLANKGGFASFAELEDVVANISFIMSGMDEDGKFQEPVELLKEELAEIKADSELSAKEKKEIVESIEESIARTPKLKYSENVTLVAKYQKELAAAMPDQEEGKN